jgi:hypothetical protein
MGNNGDRGGTRLDTITCPNCGSENQPSIKFCTDCGLWLQNIETRQDMLSDQEIRSTLEAAEHEPKSTIAAPQLEAGTIAFAVVGTPNTILIQYEQPILLGRDAGTRPSDYPLVDLNDARGYVMGVSRQHALIQQVDDRYFISDQGSSNGTFVNGSRLKPYQDHEIHHGDRLILGQLNLIFFHKNELTS